MYKRNAISFRFLATVLLYTSIAQGAEKLAPDDIPKDAVLPPVATFNFDTDALGKPPSRFSLAVTGEGRDIHWEVVRDGKAPSPPNILVQNGSAKPGDNFALALLDGIVKDHGDISVQFKALSGDENQSAGIVFRYQDPGNYYVIAANAQDETCTLYRMKKGKLKLLDTKDAIITPLTWHELRVTFVKDNYTALVGKELVLGGKDSSFKNPGLVGLWTQSDSHIAFDDFRVSQ
jgi:hypothetical protein